MTYSYLIPKTEEAKGSCDRKYKRTTVFAFQVSSFSFQHASHTNNHSHLIVNQKALNNAFSTPELFCVVRSVSTGVENVNNGATPFATAHTFCASRDGPRKLDFLTGEPNKTKVFWATYKYAGKAGLSKGYWNLKRQLGVTMDFSEIT